MQFNERKTVSWRANCKKKACGVFFGAQTADISKLKH